MKPRWRDLLLTCLLTACSGQPATEFSQLQQPIENGEATDGFGAVVALMDEGGTPFCTASVISSFELLTAAHCLLPPSPRLSAIYLGSVPPLHGALAEVAQVWVDPAYDRETRFHDLALVTSKQDLGVTPLPVRRSPLPASAVGGEVRVVGFGRDSSSAELQKRTGIARVSAVGSRRAYRRPC